MLALVEGVPVKVTSLHTPFLCLMAERVGLCLEFHCSLAFLLYETKGFEICLKSVYLWILLEISYSVSRHERLTVEHI